MEKRTIFLTDVVIPAVGREVGRGKEREGGKGMADTHDAFKFLVAV